MYHLFMNSLFQRVGSKGLVTRLQEATFTGSLEATIAVKAAVTTLVEENNWFDLDVCVI